MWSTRCQTGLVGNLTLSLATGLLAVVRVSLGFAFLVGAAAGPLDVPVGARLSIRLRDPISSRRALPGETVSTTLIAPVRVDGKELIPAGFLVQGSVASPTAAHKRLNHSVLHLTFGSLTGKTNQPIAFEARLLSVDNARETVDSGGVIHGLRPLRRRPTEVEDLLLLAAAAHPAVLASLELGRFIVAEEDKPHINYEPGVEFWLVLTAPLHIPGLPMPEAARQPITLEQTVTLRQLVDLLPLRTQTTHGAASDLINVAFLGSEQGVTNAFMQAGWMPAQTLDLKTEAKTFLAVADHHSYHEGPVSSLVVDGRTPDLVFEKEANTFSKRHHIRIWRTDRPYDGQPVWVGAGTHDTGIDFSRKSKTFTHSVDPDIDAERLKIQNDLAFTGAVTGAALMDRPSAPRSLQNATGDKLHTDGTIAVIRLAPLP